MVLKEGEKIGDKDTCEERLIKEKDKSNRNGQDERKKRKHVRRITQIQKSKKSRE